MRVLFIDVVTYKPYDPNVLALEPLGGTEGSVIRVAEGLAKAGIEVQVSQHIRKEAAMFRANYTPFGQGKDFKPTHVVVLRAPDALREAKRQFPNAKLYLWLHDIVAGDAWSAGYQSIIDTQTIPILVSDWHRHNFYDTMQSVRFSGAIPSRRIYNPIDNDLLPDSTPVDTNKLVFFSSPHKGLERTLEVFKQFKNFSELKEMKLYVANPGYFKDKDTSESPNVINLGPLRRDDVIGHVRSALGVFHLNSVYPETMGIVHAECNSVGTPFLSHNLGATPEIADHPAELIDVTDSKKVIERIIDWRLKGRPKVRGQAAFRTSRIVKEWIELFEVS